MKKRALCILNCAFLLIATPTAAAFAETQTITFSTKMPSTYEVELPLAITLDSNASFSEQINVSGDISSNEKVSLSLKNGSTDTIYLQNGEYSLPIDCELSKVDFSCADILNGAVSNTVCTGQTASSVNKNAIVAGEWTGELAFQIEVVELSNDVVIDQFNIDNVKAEVYPNTVKFSLINPTGVTKITGQLQEEEETGYQSLMAQMLGERNITGAVTVEEGIETIGEHSFKGAKIKTVILPESCKTLENTTFRQSTIESIDLSHIEGSIPYNSFAFCNNLKSVTLSDKITSIGEMAFYGCSNEALTIYVPASVTSINENAFKFVNNVVLSKNSTLEIPEHKWGATNVTKEI